MSNIPPMNAYANYPRANAGDVAKIEKLVEGYFGLNQAVFLNLLMLIGLNVASAFSNEKTAMLLFPLLLVIPVVLFFVSRPHVSKIGEGLDWSKGTVTGHCLLIAAFFWFCFGAIGFIAVQNKAMKGLNAFGFQGGGLFTSKKKIMAFVEEFKARVGNSGTVPPMSL